MKGRAKGDQPSHGIYTTGGHWYGKHWRAEDPDAGSWCVANSLSCSMKVNRVSKWVKLYNILHTLTIENDQHSEYTCPKWNDICLNYILTSASVVVSVNNRLIHCMMGPDPTTHLYLWFSYQLSPPVLCSGGATNSPCHVPNIWYSRYYHPGIKNFTQSKKQFHVHAWCLAYSQLCNVVIYKWLGVIWS